MLLAARVLALLLLAAWTGLLATPALDPQAHLTLGTVLDVRSLGDLAAAAGRLLAWLGAVALRFAPLGTLAVLALPDQHGRLKRAAFVALPAIPLALLLAWVALARRAGSPPGPFELVLPGLGILLGAWAGLAWRRGWRARILFLPSVVAQAGVLALAAAALFVLALEAEPRVGDPKALSSAEKRQLVERFEGRNPRQVPVGETRMLRLTAGELDRMASWAAQSIGSSVRPQLRLREGGLSAVASVRVPRVGLWLNAEGAARAVIEKGRVRVDGPELRVGRFLAPSWLLRAVTPFVVAGLQGDRDLRAVLPAVESLAFTPETATLVYARADMPPGLIARLVWGEEQSAATRAVVYELIDRLLAALEATPRGDARFARALETAFAAARERSGGAETAVDENRRAILALGSVLGHPRLARSVGERIDDARADAAVGLMPGTTLRGRSDWSRHFAVSAALTVMSASAPSDAAGLLKEELDADGGSGFSFGDLLADRSGTRFAEEAIRDEASARRIQELLATGFRVADFVPPADDLPEGIQDTELQSRFGGVGGPLYRTHAEEIERRLSACPAYR